jgi:ABC-2 type transport system ATP-binding protein
VTDFHCDERETALADKAFALELRNLTKQFGSATPAVNGLNLTVTPGTVLGLLGPNGAGKSTALRMCMGLLRPSGGAVRVLGLDVFQCPSRVKQRVGYVPEASHIHGWMTVGEVTAFCRALYRTWNDQECESLLDMFHLPVGKRVRQLSKGMLAKLSLVLALAHEPELLVLDEPLSGLDPIARDEFLDGVLKGLCDSARRTIVFSSHQLDEVNRLADTVAVLNAGRLLVHTTLDDLRSARRIRAVLDEGRLPNDVPPEAIWQSVNRREWQLTLYPFSYDAVDRLRDGNHVSAVEVSDLSLDDIFKDFVRGQAPPC